MPTDYILFVHGVNNRSKTEFEATAAAMFDRIQRRSQTADPNSGRTLKNLTFFWGDLNMEAEDQLKNEFIRQSDSWKEFWFQDFRTEEILRFVGDGALYLSRAVGSAVVRRLSDLFRKELNNPQPGDRLHFVTHSWGTVILFDILFARRWEDPTLDKGDTADMRERVQEIRNALFGMGDSIKFGFPVASIHTMGSPIALFNLINKGSSSGHDLSPNMQEFLSNLYQSDSKPLPWRNYAHPGDPIAYPLEGVLNSLLNGSARYVEIDDVISRTNPVVKALFSQRMIPVLWGGEAHGSYWKDPDVSNTIATIIQQTPKADRSKPNTLITK